MKRKEIFRKRLLAPPRRDGGGGTSLGVLQLAGGHGAEGDEHDQDQELLHGCTLLSDVVAGLGWGEPGGHP
jgi:hypothetical protein